MPGNSAYQVLTRRGDRPAPLVRCAVCGEAVEPWAIPLDVRVPALCDRCQRTDARRQVNEGRRPRG